LAIIKKGLSTSYVLNNNSVLPGGFTMKFVYCVVVASLLAVETIDAADEASTTSRDVPQCENVTSLREALRDTLRDIVREFDRQLTYLAGKSEMDILEIMGARIRAKDRVLLAELDLSETREGRCAILEQRVKNFCDLESVAERRFLLDTSSSGRVEVLESRAARLAAEIHLMQERSDDK
jgi:hypothetical protein